MNALFRLRGSVEISGGEEDEGWDFLHTPLNAGRERERCNYRLPRAASWSPTHPALAASLTARSRKTITTTKKLTEKDCEKTFQLH